MQMSEPSSSSSLADSRTSDIPSDSDWWRRPLRAVHTVLREPDAADYDLPGVLDWLRRWRANVYAVNGGGLCAFYTSTVPLHRPNRFLNGRDLFKEIVDACHAEGIKVVARMDFRGGHPEAFESHPDWFARDADGQPKMTTVLHAACPNSPYRNEGYAFKLIDEVLGRCNADGIWENAASFGGRCYCPTCTRLFTDDTGISAIPLEENWDDPAWRRYVLWRYERVLLHTRAMRDVVKRNGATKSYCGEFFTFLEGGAREAAEDVDEIRDFWDYQMACIFPLTRGSMHSPLLPVPLWRAEEQMKYLRATGGGNWFGPGAEADASAYGSGGGAVPHRTPQTPVMLYGHFDNSSRYTTPAPEEMRLWLAGMAAQGGAPWDCSFVGCHPGRWWDRRHQDVQEHFYTLMADHEADFADLESVAEVAVIHSQRTQDRFASGDPARDGYVTHFRGWELALFETHRQWDVVTPSGMSLDGLRRYRAVVLPNVACLSEGDAVTLREYVNQGGALLATYETGCYEADGAPRETGILDDLFGIEAAGPRRGPLQYSYTRISTRDALTTGLEDTDIVTNEGFIRNVTARVGATVHTTLIPEIIPQPPDLSYPPASQETPPTLITYRAGKGRAVYFAGQTDRLNTTSGHPDYARLLENALAWALAGSSPMVHVATPSPDDAADVHATLLRQPATGNLYLHLVNYSGARGRPVRAPHKLGPLKVTVSLPSARLRHVELLISGKPAALTQGTSQVTLTVPELELYEVLKLW
jgi:hypothetical protein